MMQNFSYLVYLFSHLNSSVKIGPKWKNIHMGISNEILLPCPEEDSLEWRVRVRARVKISATATPYLFLFILFLLLILCIYLDFFPFIF